MATNKILLAGLVDGANQQNGSTFLKVTDNGDGTVSLNISADLTLDPTNLATNAGAAHLATTHATSTGTAATLVVARPTRRSVLIRNVEAAGSGKNVWVGPATVTSAVGTLIAAGESLSFTWVGLLQVIDDNTNHAVLNIADEYD